MIDIKQLDDDVELSSGDVAYSSSYDATEQHKADILVGSQGDYAAAPLIGVGLESEGVTMSVNIALQSEAVPFLMMQLSSEVRNLFGDADYLIYVPAAIDTDSLMADIERFRTAGSRYRIIAAKYLALDDGRRVTLDNGDFITLIQF